MRRVLQLFFAAMVLPIGVGLLVTTRCVLAWDDLPSYAKPDGFREVAHQWKCEGNGNCPIFLDYGCDAYCYHDWLYVSDHEDYEDGISRMARAYRERGWSVFGCGGPGVAVEPSNPCGFAAVRMVDGKWEECFTYSDAKTNARSAGHDGFPRAHAKQIDAVRAAILVSTSCG